MEPTLDLERFAALSAELESGVSREELCAREKISTEALASAQELWLGKMADEAARKRFDLTNRYNAAFVARRRALDGGKRGVGRSSSLKVARPPLAAPPPIAAAPPISNAPPAELAPPLSQAPSMMAAPPPMMAAPPPMMAAPPPMMAAPPMTPAPPIVAAPPMMPAPRAIVAAPTIMGALVPDEPGHATEEGPSPLARPASPLPFKPGAGPPALSQTGPKIVAKQDFTGTLDGEVISPFAKKTALPFGGKEKPAAAPKRPAPAETVALPVFTDEMIAQGQEPGSETLGPSASPLRAKRNPLPFKPGAEGPPPSTPTPSTRGGGLPFTSGGPVGNAAPPAPQSAAAPPTPQSSAAPPAPQNSAAPPAARSSAAPPVPVVVAPPAGAPAAKPSPSAPDSMGRASRFTLEQFASLSAEIAVHPAAVAQVRARYGLDEASHRAEAEGWNRRFSADKELYARYGALFQSFREWLSKQGR